MKILGSDIRVGNIIEYKNDLWKCLKNQTSNRGNLRSHNQVELKSITKGTKLNERFRADETVEKASLEEKKFQFLYSMILPTLIPDPKIFIFILRTYIYFLNMFTAVNGFFMPLFHILAEQAI